MKKYANLMIFALFTALMFGSFVVSAPREQVNSCLAKPYPVSNPVTRGLQRFLGMNLLASKAAESQIKSQLSKLAQGQYDIDLKTYSAMDLAAGKFKDLTLEGKNIYNADKGISLSYIKIESLCDFIWLDYKKDPIQPLAPVYLSFKTVLTEDDLRRIISSSEFQRSLKNIGLRAFNRDIFTVSFRNLNADIVNDKIFMIGEMETSGVTKSRSPVRIGMGLDVDRNGNIRPRNVEFDSPALFGIDKFIAQIIEFVNPIDFAIRSLEYGGRNLDVKNLVINNDKIEVDGTFWLPSSRK